MQLVRERGVGGEPEGDEQWPRLAAEERRRVVMLIRRGVRLRALELDRAQRGGGEVERGLGVAASPQRVERPDHAGRTDVEVLQRQRLLPPVPFVRGPERVGIERRVSVGDDRGDRVHDARGIPRLVGQRFELRWFVEHGVSLLLPPTSAPVQCSHGLSGEAADPSATSEWNSQDRKKKRPPGLRSSLRPMSSVATRPGKGQGRRRAVRLAARRGRGSTPNRERTEGAPEREPDRRPDERAVSLVKRCRGRADVRG